MDLSCRKFQLIQGSGNILLKKRKGDSGLSLIPKPPLVINSQSADLAKLSG
jgi:hypothetical protein